jgi:chromosomal replication initiation ATPase DnaA
MENVDGKIKSSDSVCLSLTELQELRRVFVSSIKKLDKVMGARDLKGKTLARRIFNDLCRYYKVTPAEMRTYRRKPELVHRKKIAAYLLRNYTDRSYQEIAYILGYDRHATVLFHVRDVENMLSDEVYGNKQFKVEYKKIIERLNLSDYEN